MPARHNGPVSSNVRPQMTNTEERYVHFASCIDWLNECWRLLQEIKEEKTNPLTAAAFRFATILYSKPYRESRGNTIRKHRLDTAFIPEQFLSLHMEILNDRDQLHAHSDLTILDARLTVHRFEEKKSAQIVRNMLDATRLLPKLDDIIALVEGTLDQMYIVVKNLESQLPETEA